MYFTLTDLVMPFSKWNSKFFFFLFCFFFLLLSFIFFFLSSLRDFHLLFLLPGICFSKLLTPGLILSLWTHFGYKFRTSFLILFFCSHLLPYHQMPFFACHKTPSEILYSFTCLIISVSLLCPLECEYPGTWPTVLFFQDFQYWKQHLAWLNLNKYLIF